MWFFLQKKEKIVVETNSFLFLGILEKTMGRMKMVARAKNFNFPSSFDSTCF